MSKATTRLTALMTIASGTPKDPAGAAPGDDFDCPADEAQSLITRGIARPARVAAPPPPPPSPVEIPPGWADFSAAELVKLARDLGAPWSVNRRDEAHEFVTKVVAERAASQPPV